MAENYNGYQNPARDDHVTSSGLEPGSTPPVKPQKPFKYRKSEPSTKLYVFPLKESDTQETLSSIFSNFGEVTDIYIDLQKHKWAFVFMKTQEAAARAMRELVGAEFAVTYANVKSQESTAKSPKSTSHAEVTYRRGEDAPSQTGSQFINSFKGISLKSRTVLDTSEKFLPSFQFSPDLFPAPNTKYEVTNLITIPNCLCCKRQTCETCTKCHQPFCSKQCMILGYQGHIDQCISAPLHSLERQNSTPIHNAVPRPTPAPLLNVVPQINGISFPTISQDFADTSQNYLNHRTKNPAVLSNSYAAEDVEHETRNSEDKIHRNFKQFASRQPDGDSSSKNTENIQVNGTHHRMKDNKQGRHFSSNNVDASEDGGVDFGDNIDGTRRLHEKRERGGKFNHSSKESTSSRDDSFTASKRRSENESNSSWQSQSRATHNRSKKENESPGDGQSRRVHPKKENRKSGDSKSMVGGYSPRKEKESKWESKSMVGYNPKEEEEASWDNKSDEGHSSIKRVQSNRSDESSVSEQRSKKEDDSSWDNEHYRRRSNKDNESSRNTQSRPRKESTASRIRSTSRENDLSRENRSQASEFSRNQSNERTSDDETSSKRRLDRTQRDVRPREFENKKNVNASPRSPQTPPSPQKSRNNGLGPRNSVVSPSSVEVKNENRPRPRIPHFSPPPRVEIKNKAKFEVRLDEHEPPSVIISKEADALNYMVEALQKFHLEPMDQLEREDRCIATKHEDDNKIWYRCKIHETDPLSVKFIDFNYTPVRVHKENVRKLPAEFTSIPPFSYRVRFLNAKNYELDGLKNSEFEVEFVSKNAGIWDVNLVRKSFEDEMRDARNIRDGQTRSESSRTVRNSKQDNSDWEIILKKDKPIEVFVWHIVASSKKIFVGIMNKSRKMMDMIENMNPSSLPELKELRLNISCLAFFEGCWNRAKIVSVDPLRVYYIDFGNTEAAQKKDLKMSPDEFDRIPPLVVPVKFRSGSHCSVRENETIEIIPIEELLPEKIWVIRLASESSVIEEKRSNDLKSSYNENTPNVAIDSILDVQVTHIISSTEYYVGPIDLTEKLNEMMIEEAAVRKMEPLKTSSLGTPCVALFEGYWSRAKIVKSEPLTVLFVDFGNSSTVELKDLYPLPEKKLLDIPPLAFKIHLQEPEDLADFIPYKIRKVSEKFWRVESALKVELGADMDVLILAAVEENTFGVIPVEMNSTFEAIQSKLLKMKPELPRVEKPEVYMTYAECSNVVARVEVRPSEPNYLSLYYLDFGYEERKDTYCDLRTIPDSLAQIEPIAFRITADSSELREGQTISIKILSTIILDDHYFVKVIESDLLSDSLSQYDSASEANTTFLDTVNSPASNLNNTRESDVIILPSLSERQVGNDDNQSEIGSINTVDFIDEFCTTHPTLPKTYRINEIPVGARFVLTVMKNLNDSLCTGMMMQSSSPHIQFLKKYMTNLRADPYYRPEVGDIIAAAVPNTEIWSRAVVLSEPNNLKTKYRVAMFDIGCVHEVDEIASLDDKFNNLSNLSVYCEIKRFPDNKKPLKLFKTYNKCNITERLHDGTVIGCVEAKPNQKYVVSFKPWKPTFDELGIAKLPVKNESRVQIVSYNTTNTCHITSCDEKTSQAVLMFSNDMPEFCDAAEPMTENPFISEIVGVKYENSFWRGQVMEKLENTYSIFLLDRGIKCTSSLEHMRSLPYSPSSSSFEAYLKTSCAFAVPVTLKNVPITDITPNVSTFLQRFIKDDCKFNMFIDDSTGEVELAFLADESYPVDTNSKKTLNECLANMLIPEWKKCLNAHDLTFDDYLMDFKFTANDIRYDTLVIGSKVSLFVGDVSNADFCIVHKNGENYTKLFEVNLFERLADYATSVPNPYVPGPEELCIVEFDNTWYRALCLEAKPNADICVQLIDEGRIVMVSHFKIRKMIPEFCHYVATALMGEPDPKEEIQFDIEICKALASTTIRVRVLEMIEPERYMLDCRKLFA